MAEPILGSNVAKFELSPSGVPVSVVVALLLPAGLGGEGEGDLGAVGLSEDGLGLVHRVHGILVLGEGDADFPKIRNLNKVNQDNFEYE